MAFGRDDAYQYLIQRGLSPVAAAGLVGNMGAESGYQSDINERSGGGGYGLMQWTGPRRAELTQYAADTGGSAADPHTQLDFMMKELGTSEKRAGDMLASASDASSANSAALAYLRPAGWTPNGDVSRSSQFDTRLANTRSLLGDAPPAPAPTPYTPAPPQADEPVPAYVPPQQDGYGAALGQASRGLTSLFSQPPAAQPAQQSAGLQPPPMPAAPMMAQRGTAPVPMQPAAMPTRDSVGDLRRRQMAALGRMGGWS